MAANFLSAENYYYYYCCCRNTAAVVGVAWLTAKLLKGVGQLYNGFRAYFLSPWLGLGRLNFTKYGAWAVVTGASEGIGRSYALELARRGLNVVLMSRSNEKLQKVADEIKKEYGRDTLVIPVDFSTGGSRFYEGISEQLKDLDIGVLVNNVGMYYGKNYAYLDEVSLARLCDMIEVNCQPVVQMTRLLLPEMVKKKRGVVINISSVAGTRAVPLMTVYSAAKIYMKYISDGLRKEYGYKGIIFQNVTPFFVSTRMTGFMSPGLFIPTPQTYVRSALATVGIQDNTHGYFPHAILGYRMAMIPEYLLDRRQMKVAMIARRKQATEKKTN